MSAEQTPRARPGRVGLLHTAAVHVSTFDALFAARPDIDVIHTVEAGWLEEARANGLHDALVASVAQRLNDLAAEAAAVICTCSTLGAVAEAAGSERIFRIDAPMMREAARLTELHGAPPLLVMCLRSTLESSVELLERSLAAAGQKAELTSLVCEDAWPHFESGDLDRFGRAVAARVRERLAVGRHSAVVLAQASMAAAVPYLDGCDHPVLSSPELAVDQALALTDS